MKAIILAAGRGTRLKPVTDHVPKPLIPFFGKPFIEYTLDEVHGLVDEIVLVVRHHGDQIRAALGEEHLGVPLRYVWQGELRGSGDALLQAREYMTDPTLVILGDVYVARESVELMMEADSEFVLSAAHVDDPENHLGVQIGDYSGVDGVLEAMRLFAERIGRADPAGLEHQIAALGRTGSDHGEPVGMASDHCCTSCVDDPD